MHVNSHLMLLNENLVQICTFSGKHAHLQYKKQCQNEEQINPAPLWLHSIIDYQYSPYSTLVMGDTAAATSSCTAQGFSENLIKKGWALQD